MKPRIPCTVRNSGQYCSGTESFLKWLSDEWRNKEACSAEELIDTLGIPKLMAEVSGDRDVLEVSQLHDHARVLLLIQGQLLLLNLAVCFLLQPASPWFR